MENESVNHAAPDAIISAAKRISILQRLLAIALDLTAVELGAFSARLSDALLKLSSQSARPGEAELSLNALHQLQSNRTAFSRAVTERLTGLLRAEIGGLERDRQAMPESNEQDLALVTFDEMESKVMLANV
jgi:hypothetical protein